MKNVKRLARAFLAIVFFLIFLKIGTAETSAAYSYLNVRLYDDENRPIRYVNVVIWNATLNQTIGVFTSDGGGNVRKDDLDTSYSYNIGANKTTDIPYKPEYSSLQGDHEATGLIPGTFTAKYYSRTDVGKIPINMEVKSEVLPSPTPTSTPTPTPIPCPYNSIQPVFRVMINGVWKEWKSALTINQWQTDWVQAGVFFDGTQNFTDINNVQMVFSGNFLNQNPANVSPYLQGTGYYALGATGVGICENLGTATASLNIVYCPYEEIFVNSNRGRPCTKDNPGCPVTDPWLPDIKINKKDVKEGRVMSGTYYNSGGQNLWAPLSNLDFILTKPNGEVLNFRDAPGASNSYRYVIPPSWYTSGFYLNRPGTYNLTATATNNGATCGDYPPQSRGTINVINCSYDYTVAGFQNVASPPPAWTASLYLPYTGAAVKSAGFHDRSLASIPPDADNIKIYTPAEQVILRITEASGFDQRADQGAPFTYTLGGTYSLSVTTPDLDTSDPDDIEDGIGCYASATMTIGQEPPPNVCEDTGERIPCCPFELSGQSLWDGLVNLLGDLLVYLAANNSIAPFKMGVSVDKIEFTADRTRQADLLFGKKKADGTLEPGAVFKLSPPGPITKCGISTDSSDGEKIEKREERTSWDVSLEGGNEPLKEGDMADVAPASCAADQIQGYLTRLPGAETGIVQKNQQVAGIPQSFSLRAQIGSASVTYGSPVKTSPRESSEENPLQLSGKVLAQTTTPTPTPTPTPGSGTSCQEELSRPVKEVECYETSESGSVPNTDLTNLLLILENSDSLLARVSYIDVLSRSLVGSVSVCDTNGRGCTDKTISENAGALDLFKIPGGKGYKNIAAEGKISPIRYTVEIGSPVAGIPGPIMLFLALPPELGGYGIPLTGSGTVPADDFSPDLENCSIVYTGQGTYSDIYSPKLSCVYIIDNPQLKARYWGSVQSAFYNTGIGSAEPGVQCKMDIPGGNICSGATDPKPTVTPPPGFKGSCNICDFNRGGSGQTLENILNEAAGAVGTPASVLAGMLNFEGYVPDNPDPNKRHIFNYSDEEIEQISQPGEAMPYCAESYLGAKGPCQFMPDQWSTYGGTISNYGYSHTPNICNLRDCLYAAAAKMRNNAAIIGSACGYNNETPPPDSSCDWTGENAAKSAYHYYGGCTDNYVETVVNYYYNYACQ